LIAGVRWIGIKAITTTRLTSATYRRQAIMLLCIANAASDSYRQEALTKMSRRMKKKQLEYIWPRWLAWSVTFLAISRLRLAASWQLAGADPP